MGLGDAQTFQAEVRALGQGTVQSVEGMVNPRVGAGGWWESQCLWGRDATEKAQGIGWGQKEALWIPSFPGNLCKGNTTHGALPPCLWIPGSPGLLQLGLSTFLLNVTKKACRQLEPVKLSEQRCDSFGALSRS